MLADIPLIGNLFKPSSEKVERTELIIFIRPTMVKSEPYSSLLAKNKIGSEEVTKEVAGYFENGKFHDPQKETMGVENRKYSSFEKTLLPASMKSGKKKSDEAEPAAKKTAEAEKGAVETASSAEEKNARNDKKLRGAVK